MDKGFTLIELSIVMIIISLIVASITGGKALIRQAEIQSVVKDIESFKTAFNTFRLKYDALPGDMENAGDYWGPIAIVFYTGHGNQIIEPCGCPGLGEREDLRVWQHLVLSSVLEGGYTGIGNGGNAHDFLIGENLPPSEINNTGYTAATFSFGGRTGVGFRHGGANGVVVGNLPNGAMSSVDAHSLDSKVDDGNAGTGDVMGIESGGFPDECLGGGVDYDKSNKEPTCKLHFWTDI